MGHCKISQGNAQCPDDSYCDLATSMCEPCHIHCDPLRDTWTNCQRHCPEFYAAMMNKNSTLTTTTLTTMQINTTSITGDKSHSVAANIVLTTTLVSFIIIIFLLVVLLLLNIIFKVNVKNVKFLLRKVFCLVCSAVSMKRPGNNQDPENPVIQMNYPVPENPVIQMNCPVQPQTDKGNQHMYLLLTQSTELSNESAKSSQSNNLHGNVVAYDDLSTAENEKNDLLAVKNRGNQRTCTGTLCSKCSSQEKIQRLDLTPLDQYTHTVTLDSNTNSGEGNINPDFKHKTSVNKTQKHQDLNISPVHTNKMTPKAPIYENQPILKPKERREKNKKHLDDNHFNFNLYSTIYYPKDDLPDTNMEGIESVTVESGYKTEEIQNRKSEEKFEFDLSHPFQCEEDLRRDPGWQNRHNSGSLLGAVGGTHHGRLYRN